MLPHLLPQRIEGRISAASKGLAHLDVATRAPPNAGAVSENSFMPTLDDRAAPVKYFESDALAALTKKREWAGQLLDTDPGLVAFVPPDVSHDYAPLVLRVVGGTNSPPADSPQLAWTYLADPCLEQPALVGGRTLIHKSGGPLRLRWANGWFGESDEGQIPVGPWIDREGLRVWAPILSTVEVVRRLGAAEEGLRLARRAVRFALMQRDRLIVVAEVAEMNHAEIARWVGLSRRRIDQVLSAKSRRTQVKAGLRARGRDAISSDELEELTLELGSIHKTIASLREREGRFKQQRHKVHDDIREAGFSQREVGELLGISKPRVQQLRGRPSTRVGGLYIS